MNKIDRHMDTLFVQNKGICFIIIATQNMVHGKKKKQ